MSVMVLNSVSTDIYFLWRSKMREESEKTASSVKIWSWGKGKGCVYVLQVTMQFLPCSLNHRWAFSNVWGHLRKSKNENSCNHMRTGREHQKLKQSFICKTFWSVHLPTSWLQILASPFMSKHWALQSSWSQKAWARCAKQGQNT